LQLFQHWKKNTIGFGTVEQGLTGSEEDIQQYNIVTNINLEYCKNGVSIPLR
jgi:hypothetical protein